MPLMGWALFVEVTMENIQTSGLLLALRLNEVNRNEALEEHRDYIAAYSLEVINCLQLASRVLQCVALIFNGDGLVPHQAFC